MRISKWPLAMVTVLTIGPTGTILAQHWGYEGEAGPQNWGKLDPNFGVCASGKNQSPIDLKGFIEADMKPLKLDYKAGIADIARHGHGIADMVNNGHTVQVNHAPGSTLSVDGITFELKQFHFHSPSENKINGKQFPLEGHLVHADKDGNLAVLAVMFQEGAANTLLAQLWEKMPNKAGEKSALATGLSVSQLLPDERDYYRFNGSLTTPPCRRRTLVRHKEASYGLQGADPTVFQGDRVRQQSADSIDKRALHPAIAVKFGGGKGSEEERAMRSDRWECAEKKRKKM